MSSGMFCMLETKDEEKEEGEVSTELVQEEELEKDFKSSSKVLFSAYKVTPYSLIFFTSLSNSISVG